MGQGGLLVMAWPSVDPNPDVSPRRLAARHKVLSAMRKRTVLGAPSAVQLVSAASLPGRWLGYACPDLSFGQAIATAIPCAPARRPDSPIRRHRPGSLVKHPG